MQGRTVRSLCGGSANTSANGPCPPTRQRAWHRATPAQAPGACAASAATAALQEPSVRPSDGADRQASSRSATATPPSPQRPRGSRRQRKADAQEWSGLKQWRARGVDRGRGWGDEGPSASVPAPGAQDWADTPLASSLVECAVQVLQTACPYGKAVLTHRAWAAYNSGALPLHPLSLPDLSALHPTVAQQHSTAGVKAHPSVDTASQISQPSAAQTALTSGVGIRSMHTHAWSAPPTEPGRPAKPVLVVPKQVRAPESQRCSVC